ncbi:YqeG family HAD IIIA-type phosphatase [Shouchella lonarensis]|uniref:YqeG family HAD IIIA-type phosphatase n=1 Tax=Shouchella lonarensis TaxID=1464122 RepID=A0A1G6KFG2_9BACI|nr:YqeG family HAD IIIA-type phosphatase [Shouchella lonarensis]SDC29694.1 hypothetical protein SAMN05421737_10712 [Shouchella lonarensis]
MLKHLLPDQYVKNIYEIDVAELSERGVKAVITDLDNTLVAWDYPTATVEVCEWFGALKKAGFQIMVVSNNHEKRVKDFCDPEKVRFIYNARKPLKRAFQQACKQMAVRPEEAVVVGDQMFTDVLGGNRAGLHTILVVPVVKTDGWMTRMNRRMERIVLKWMRRKGYITWEDKS